MTQPTVLIVGPGRSGTSTVARLCHEKIGISMGRFLKPGDEFNPEGYYEDYVSHGLIRNMAAGVMSPEVYLQIWEDLYWDDYPEPWGVKDPWLLYLPDDILSKLTPKLAIFCSRNTDDVTRSFMRIYDAQFPAADDARRGAAMSHHQKRAHTRSQRMSELLTANLWPSLELDFNQPRSTAEILSLIRDALVRAVPYWRQP